MEPIGPLMIEHRLIERMVKLLGEESDRIKNGSQVNSAFIDSAVDFFRIYADKTHHGKEEDILFKELEKKNISEEHRKIVQELLDEHVIARKNVKALKEANERYINGERAQSEEIARILDILTGLYPPHIEKEDKHFFIPILDYFDKSEREEMLRQFFDFDRTMIHEKYKNVVENFEII